MQLVPFVFLSPWVAFSSSVKVSPRHRHGRGKGCFLWQMDGPACHGGCGQAVPEGTGKGGFALLWSSEEGCLNIWYLLGVSRSRPVP